MVKQIRHIRFFSVMKSKKILQHGMDGDGENTVADTDTVMARRSIMGRTIDLDNIFMFS